jgi:CBS domain-containing protein
MTRDVRTITPETTLKTVAEILTDAQISSF